MDVWIILLLTTLVGGFFPKITEFLHVVFPYWQGENKILSRILSVFKLQIPCLFLCMCLRLLVQGEEVFGPFSSYLEIQCTLAVVGLGLFLTLVLNIRVREKKQERITRRIETWDRSRNLYQQTGQSPLTTKTSSLLGLAYLIFSRHQGKNELSQRLAHKRGIHLVTYLSFWALMKTRFPQDELLPNPNSLAYSIDLVFHLDDDEYFDNREDLSKKAAHPQWSGTFMDRTRFWSSSEPNVVYRPTGINKYHPRK